MMKSAPEEMSQHGRKERSTSLSDEPLPYPPGMAEIRKYIAM